MAKLTIGFGVLLIVLGIFGYVATGSAHPTALIPVWIGILFVLFGVMANTENSKRRMLWMHVSVTVALLVFLGMIPAMIDVYRLAHGVSFPYPAAVEEKAALGLFSLIYVLFCFRSFINARRSRVARYCIASRPGIINIQCKPPGQRKIDHEWHLMAHLDSEAA